MNLQGFSFLKNFHTKIHICVYSMNVMTKKLLLSNYDYN